jgi:tRNA-dihydrouridine synthase
MISDDPFVVDVSSVMIARGAEYNPTVFRKEGKIELIDVLKAYLKKVSN